MTQKFSIDGIKPLCLGMILINKKCPENVPLLEVVSIHVKNGFYFYDLEDTENYIYNNIPHSYLSSYYDIYSFEEECDTEI